MMFKFTAILSVALAASLSFGQGEQPKAEPIAAPPGAAPIKPQQVRVRTRHPSDPVKVLFCTSSYGFKHDVLPLAREIMTKRGESLKWLEVTATESADAITGTNLLPALAEIDVLMLYTTGKLPFDARQLAAWVEAGGTLVGVHSATDTLSEDPDYVPLIGGVFDGHPWNEEVTLVAPDTNFAQPDLGFTAEYQTNPSRYTFRLSDEIYQFKQLSKDRTVTLRLAPGQPKMEEGRDYPIAWTSVRGKGRVFYTALGHGPNVWNNEEFVQHV
ncbi:MAG: ThuA domain-containing protein, partial [bacterium]|nr:ThuA domain-containing protein [bacterium]